MEVPVRPTAAKLIAAATVIGIVALAAPAGASFPGGNGDIAYLAVGGSGLAIRAIDPDGMNDHRLSIGPRDAVDAEYLPDGASAVIAESGGRRGRIVLQDLATSVRSVVVSRADMPGFPFSLGVSPDGTRVVFCSLGRLGFRLHVVGIDGSDLTRISQGTDDCHADWGVNDRIVATEESTSGDRVLFHMAPDGSDRQPILSWEEPPHQGIVFFLVPSWSPDATSIVFGGQRSTRQSEIWKVDPDGSDLVRLTSSPRRNDYGPVWAPDGSRVVFTSAVLPSRRGRIPPGDLRLMDPDGTDGERLTDSRRRDEYSRSWQPLLP
jgi:Tol biopolymer transport system component